MNTFKNFKQVLLLTLSLLIIHSCVKDDDYSIPELPCDEQTVTMTLHELVAMVDADSDGIVFFDQTEPVVVEGYVVSSDEQGNFFKTVSIQDKLVNPTIGVQVEMDATNLFRKFPIGHKIQIKLNGIYAGFDRGVIKIGETYLSGSDTRVGRMAELKIKNHVQVTCDFSSVTPVEFNTIAAALASGKINTLIKINNVQFSETGVTYSEPGATTDRRIIDAQGATLVVRNSNFATFAGSTMPEGSGSITLVLSQYNSTFQSYIRDTNDVVFDQPRFGEGNGGGEGNDQEAANFLFAGADFENWTTFLGSLNSFGLTSGLAVQGIGTGRDGSNSFHLNGTTAGTNPYVFTVKATAATIPANATKITMWIKGSSAKSLSFNLDTASGRVFYNLGEFGSGNVTLSPQENNQYTGAVNTNGEWRLVTLNISGLTLNTANDLLALKAGSGTAYDLHIDNIKID